MGYTYRATGSVATNTDGSALSPGAPAGKTNGDQLRLVAWQRSTSTVAAITGWTKLGSVSASQSVEVWARIADGTADDTPSVDWSGTGSCGAFIEAYYGDVYTDLATLVAHSSAASSSGSADLALPTLTGGSVDDCEVYCASRKNNTATDATTIAHTSLTVRTQVVSTVAARSHVATGTLQQTTYADFDGENFTVNGTSESLASNGIVLYLRTAAAGTVKKLKLLTHSDAQSKTGVQGVVFTAPSGGDLVGSKIGEFTGAAFSGTLESGEAVLKVALTDFGGSALTTSDTPRVEVRYDDAGTIKGTAIVPATVIEE